MATQVDNDIWTLDGPEVVFAGASMHTRMTVVRLQDERLWVHSPIELSGSVREFINDIGGNVAALVAPNKFHYMFMELWQESYPQAQVFAEESLVRKVPYLSNAEILTNSTPSIYSRDIEQVIFGGNRMFQEVVFFHKSSRSLILTDLMINLKTVGIAFLPRMFLEFEGVTFPHGGVPRLYRWLTSDKEKAREALGIIQRWKPKHILFCHGEPFSESAEVVLDREFEYLSR